jgi:hypothetical protein
MLMRAKVWTVALALALICSVGWIFLPGECVVQPAGTADVFLRGSVYSTFVHPFAFDWVHLLYVLLKLSPIGLVLLAALHWKRRFDKLRAVAALFALALSGAVALHPYRAFSDIQLIIIVSVWGIVVLVAYESKASPGAALLALMSVQLVMSEVYSGLGVDRGLPFWIMVISLLIVFSYGIFHYTRMLRHSVLGRYTEIRRIDPAALARRQALEEQRRRLEQQ